MRLWSSLTGTALLGLVVPGMGFGQCIPCGGCSDPCASYSVVSDCGGCGSVVSTVSCGVVAAPQRELLGPGPTKGYQIRMVPKYFTEKRSVCATEYRQEERHRVVKVSRTVPVTEEKIRIKTNMTTKTETKTVTYTELVAETSTKTTQVVTTVPEWTETTEYYTVKEPYLVDVEEKYTIKVPQLSEESYSYTVQVPDTVTERKSLTVTNAVPVVKERTVTNCVPVTKTRMVTKDYGHWATQMVEEACSAPVYSVMSVSGCGSPCGGCSPCMSGCGGCSSPCVVYSAPATRTVCQRVWVPNVRTEAETHVEQQHQTQTVKYTVYEQRSEQVPYDCTYLVYRPETRTATRKVVNYVDQIQTRTRKQVEYKDVQKERKQKKLTLKEVTVDETYPVISYRTESRTKEVTYTVQVPESVEERYTVTRHDCVVDDQIETYTVSVPVGVTREVDVQVCRMVPEVYETTIHPCASATPSASCAPAPCPAPCAPAPCGPCEPCGGVPVSSGCASPCGATVITNCTSCGG